MMQPAVVWISLGTATRCQHCISGQDRWCVQWQMPLEGVQAPGMFEYGLKAGYPSKVPAGLLNE